MKPGNHIALLALIAVLSGCDRTNQTSSGTNAATHVTSDDLKDKYKNAATATKNYVAENKDEFVASMNQKLKELDDKITAMSKKSEDYKDDAKVQADKAVQSLRQERQSVNEQFEKLKQSSAEGWEKLKAGLNTAIAELDQAYTNAKSKFK